MLALGTCGMPHGPHFCRVVAVQSTGPAGFGCQRARPRVCRVGCARLLRGLANARWQDVTFGLAVAAVGLTVLYGLSDEIHQRFVPGRVADVRDLMADTIGALVGVVLVWAWSMVLSLRRPT